MITWYYMLDILLGRTLGEENEQNIQNQSQEGRCTQR